MQVDFNIYLGQGEENAVHMFDLAKELGVTDRTLRQMVFDAREEGVQILSSDKGYFLPSDNESESKAYEHRARQRALSSLRIAKSAKGNTDQIKGQLDLFTDFTW